LDIGSGNGYPESALSNFSPNKFIFDGVECNSIEGVLQSFKFNNIEMQRFVCTLVGKGAKFKGKKKKWWLKQELYWNGVSYKRDSKEYQKLLDILYETAYDQCESFRRALIATGKATLTHSMGKNKTNETILTEREFCSRLTKLRDYGRLI
jgi:hypothetical protein